MLNKNLNEFIKNLPTILIYLTIFLYALIFAIVLLRNDKITFTLVGSVIGFSTTFFFEKYRKYQKQTEIVTLLLISIAEHVPHLKVIDYELTAPRIITERYTNIDDTVVYVENNAMYELALNQIGNFDLDTIRVITLYSSGLERLLCNLKKASKKQSQGMLGVLKRQIDTVNVYATLVQMFLSQKLNHHNEFNNFKDLLKEEYTNLKLRYEQAETIHQIEQVLGNIEKICSNFGIAEEIYNSYTEAKVKHEQYVKKVKDKMEEK